MYRQTKVPPQSSASLDDGFANDSKLEEQFVLRLPPRLAQQIRSYLRGREDKEKDDEDRDEEVSKKEDDIDISQVEIDFQLQSSGATSDDGRNAVFRFGKDEFTGTLVDLPCVLETLKTNDKVNYYKSADIGQMLIIDDPETINYDSDDESKQMTSYDRHFKYDSGITPPTRNIRKRKFRRVEHTFQRKQEIAEAEQEVLKIMRGGSVGDEIEIFQGIGEDAPTPGSQFFDQELSNDSFASQTQTPPTDRKATTIKFTPPTPVQNNSPSVQSATQSPVPPPATDKKQKKSKKEKKKRKEKKEKKEKKKKEFTSGSGPATPSSKPAVVVPSPTAASPSNSFSAQMSPPSILSPLQTEISNMPSPSPNIMAFSPGGLNEMDIVEVIDSSGSAAANDNMDNLFDPELDSLRQEEQSIQNEISQLNKQTEELLANMKTANNPVITKRLETRKAQLESTKHLKLDALQRVQQALQAKQAI